MICAHCHASESEVPACTTCGQDPRLEARYHLLGTIGRGANATLYRAWDETLEHHVAIKERHPQGPLNETADRLFQREIDVLRQLDHPQIPNYVDAFASGRGRAKRHYLVQELVDGRALDQEAEDQRWTETQVRAEVAEIAGILSYLHGLSPPVVHRDLKPGNIMRRRDGTLVLVDFGAVRDTLPGTLGDATVAGTFGYMAPEQFMGEARPPSDIYGLGALAVALLSRRDPAGLHDRRRQFHWRRAVHVSEPFEALLAQMLAEDPADRPSASQVAQAIRTMELKVSPAQEPPRPRPEPSPPAKREAPKRAESGALTNLAKRGRSKVERRRRSALSKPWARRSTQALDWQQGREQRIHEALVPPAIGNILRAKKSAAALVATLVSILSIFLVILGSLWVSQILESYEPLASLAGFAVFPVAAVAVGASLYATKMLTDLSLRGLYRLFSTVELRRLRALPLPLDLESYPQKLAWAATQQRVVIRVELDRAPSASLINSLRDALKGLDLRGVVEAESNHLLLRSVEPWSHPSQLHQWTRRVLFRLLNPARDDLGAVHIKVRIEGPRS